MIRLFYHTDPERLRPERFNDLLLQLPFSFREKILKFKRWQDSQRALIGKMLLMKALHSFDRHYTLDELKYTTYNRPYFDEGIDFNLAHAEDYTVCVISTTEKLGIDIEKFRKIEVNDFRAQLNDHDWEFLRQSVNASKAFYHIWTRKEAFLKAVGIGLNYPLNEINMIGDKVFWEDSTWFLQEIVLDPGYVCHVCSSTPSPQIEIEKITFE